MNGLIPHDPGPKDERCRTCGAKAVGPCAVCQASVCGDCCVLTRGTVVPRAICLACDRRGGRSLGGPWGSLLFWLLGLMVALAGVATLLWWARS